MFPSRIRISRRNQANMLQKVKVSGLHILLCCGPLDFNPSTNYVLTVSSWQCLFFSLNREEQNGQTRVRGKSTVILLVVTEHLFLLGFLRMKTEKVITDSFLTRFCLSISAGLFHVLNRSSYRSTVLDSRNTRNTVTTCHSLEKLVSMSLVEFKWGPTSKWLQLSKAWKIKRDQQWNNLFSPLLL